MGGVVYTVCRLSFDLAWFQLAEENNSGVHMPCKTTEKYSYLHKALERAVGSVWHLHEPPTNM